MQTALEAELRTIDFIGKGASRRLRRQEKIPAIIYGGGKDPLAILLCSHKIRKAMEKESFYSSVFEIKVKGKTEHVVLKTLQRHPYKPIIMHMDLQRVSNKDMLVRSVPLHFLNEDICKGVKAGGKIIHSMNQLEVRCLAKDLPEFIEVDLAKVELDQVLHLSDLTLPKEIEITVNFKDPSHDLPVVSIHLQRGTIETEAAETKVEEEGTPEDKKEAE